MAVSFTKALGCILLYGLGGIFGFLRLPADSDLQLFLQQIYDFDRDYKDVGVAQFTTKYFVVRNCLPNAKSDMLLSAWNPPLEWGKYELFTSCLLHLVLRFGYYLLCTWKNLITSLCMIFVVVLMNCPIKCLFVLLGCMLGVVFQFKER